jgi:hypothetical protein
MSAPTWRWSLIGLWLTLAVATFVFVDISSARSWLILSIASTIPPGMMLWLWNEDRPMLIGTLRTPAHRP